MKRFRTEWWGLTLLLAGLLWPSGAAQAQCGGFTVTADRCLLICPKSDEVFKVVVEDAGGNGVCLPSGSIYLDFAGCPAIPCPGEEPNWPLVYPDSCNPATGEHYFTVDAGVETCQPCDVPLVVDGSVCQTIPAFFFDINGDLCVTGSDFLNAPCNDYDCDGAITGADQAIFDTHLDHCCQPPPCDPGKAFCDSVTVDKCLLICPLSDEVFKVTVKDSCGNPICLTGPSIYLDFAGCPAIPCPNEEPNWPLVFPDSCDAATGTHYFTVDAGMDVCTDCSVPLVVDGAVCRTLQAKFFDIDGDLCVTAADMVTGSCNDYNCDGAITPLDVDIFFPHVGHCCPSGPCPPGPPFCDSVITDPCLLVCPSSDEVFRVIVKDSCGNPLCLLGGTAPPGVWLDFSGCPARPCPNEEPFWPIVYPDSCDKATGVHYFTVDASLLDCTDCIAILWVNGQPCRQVPAKFFDTNGDGCVKPDDFLAASCNDYNCDGTIDAVDEGIFKSHLCHCCRGQCIITLTGDVNGDNVITSADIIVMVNHIFKGGPPPVPCPAAGDVNCDGVLTTADIIVLVNFVFKSGPPPCDVCSIIPSKWMCCPY